MKILTTPKEGKVIETYAWSIELSSKQYSEEVKLRTVLFGLNNNVDKDKSNTQKRLKYIRIGKMLNNDLIALIDISAKDIDELYDIKKNAGGDKYNSISNFKEYFKD